jgi:hypothetical protein
MNRFFLLLLLIPNLLFSQVTIKGSTKSTKEPLPFVNILFKNSDGKISGVVSDINSNYEITLPSGTYEIRASFMGYNSFVKQLDVKDNIQLDILLEEETTQLTEIVVKAVGQKITEAAVVRTIRNSNVVSDGVSIEFIKKTPDRNVGDALKRVSGVTIQNDKFVLVRGLADRYNSAILNKTLLPSTEPDRRAFSFDIIPTALIDNIIVSKSAGRLEWWIGSNYNKGSI